MALKAREGHIINFNGGSNARKNEQRNRHSRTTGPVQCLPVGSHDKRPRAERDIDRERSAGRTGSYRGDQGEEKHEVN